MSELINANSSRAFIRIQLLNTVSAFALIAYVSSVAPASAEDADRPTVWIELGGQMEAVQGTSTPFAAPFMSAITPTPGPYAGDIFTRTQQPAHMAFGFEGQVAFQPKDSDWIFAAAVQYGRSHTNRHAHHQSPAVTVVTFGHTVPKYAAAFADTKMGYEESHATVDFSAGKDVGLGRFGNDGTSTISAGVRFAQFSTKSSVTATGRPSVQLLPGAYGHVITFYNYTMWAHAERNFRGVGPSLSWNASTVLIGNKEEGEFTFDWEIAGAVLFGQQKAQTAHTTQAYHLPFTPYPNYVGVGYTRIYQYPHDSTRSRSVVVPNLGGFAGVSVKYPNVKFSAGYRADFFFGAVDVGIDQRHTKDLRFQGPFATFSISLGG